MPSEHTQPEHTRPEHARPEHARPEHARRAWLENWTGIALTLLGVVATLTLGVTGRLTLYIHPRYVIFTVALSVVAGVASIAKITLGHTHPHDHNHRQTHDQTPGQNHGHKLGMEAEQARADRVAVAVFRARIGAVLRGAVILATAVALLVIPPSTLSTSLGQQRGLATPSGSVPLTGVDLQGDPLSYTIKDWWTLLQSENATAVNGKPVKVLGQVVDHGDGQTFYVARQMLTCCAVDAQLIGVPVTSPNWADQVKPGEWVEVTGTFTASTAGTVPYAINPRTITPAAEPREPYVY